MPQSTGDLWNILCTFDNLLYAHIRARKGKRHTPSVALFEYNLESNLLNLLEELTSRTYQPGAYRPFTIEHAKRRMISAAPYRDRVAHHTLMKVLEPVSERRRLARTVRRLTPMARRHRGLRHQQEAVAPASLRLLSGQALPAMGRSSKSGECGIEELRVSWRAWTAHASHGDTWNLQRRALDRLTGCLYSHANAGAQT